MIRLQLKKSYKLIPKNYYKYPKMNLMTISQSLDESYVKHKIVPDIIDKFETQGLLTIEYNENDKVALGNTLKVANTQHKPTIQFTINSPNNNDEEFEILNDDKFTLILTDPDAPSNTDNKWSEYCHWIISDLSLNPTKSENPESLSTIIDFSKGNELLPYVGPGPPEKTGKHRYVFLLYKQDPNTKLITPPDRPNWGTGVAGSGVRDWIKKCGGSSKLLTVNFFYAQNEVQ